jgi:hypothetical protein
MIPPDLLITALVLLYGGLVAFGAFWRGYSKGHKDARDEAEAVLDELDEATRILGQMAARDRHPSQRALRIVEES